MAADVGQASACAGLQSRWRDSYERCGRRAKAPPQAEASTPRSGHKATLLPDRKVLLLPGEEGLDFDSAELYDPETCAFSPTDWKSIADAVAATANLLPNGKGLGTLNVQDADFLSRTAELD